MVDPTEHQIAGVTDMVYGDWSNVSLVLDNAVDTGLGDGTNDGTYFVVSNGSDARTYYWEGDANVNNMVDDGELTHFADLEGFNDFSSLGEENFQIA